MENSSVCYRTIHYGRCNDIYCPYRNGHNLSEYVQTDEENISTVPCRFLLKDSGCCGIKSERYYIDKINWRTREPISPLQSDKFYEECRHNHFYKAKYVCPVYLLNTSMDDGVNTEYGICDNSCGKLHISWKNFVDNMFNSKVDCIHHKRSSDFLVEIITELAYMNTRHENILKSFNDMYMTFTNNMKFLNEAYNSKCIVCSLPPRLPKLSKPKTQSFMYLTYTNLPLDLILYIVEFVYPQHHQCYYYKELSPKDCDVLKNIEIKRVSSIFSQGQRVISYQPKKIITTRPNNYISNTLFNLPPLIQDNILRILSN